jgi:hypothetical protein
LCILKTRLRSSSVLFFSSSSSSSFPSFHTTLCAVCDVMFPHLYRRRASDVSGEKTKMRNNAAAALVLLRLRSFVFYLLSGRFQLGTS